MKRIREAVTLDRDQVSPDAVRATNDYLTGVLEERAEFWGIAIDWSSFRVHTRRRRNGDLTIVQRASVL